MAAPGSGRMAVRDAAIRMRSVRATALMVRSAVPRAVVYFAPMTEIAPGAPDVA